MVVGFLMSICHKLESLELSASTEELFWLP